MSDRIIIELTRAELEDIVFAAVVRALRAMGYAPKTGAKIALTVPEALKAVGVGRTTLYAAIRDGKLASLTKGRRRLILLEELERWLKEGPK